MSNEPCGIPVGDLDGDGDPESCWTDDPADIAKISKDLLDLSTTGGGYEDGLCRQFNTHLMTTLLT